MVGNYTQVLLGARFYASDAAGQAGLGFGSAAAVCYGQLVAFIPPTAMRVLILFASGRQSASRIQAAPARRPPQFAANVLGPRCLADVCVDAAVDLRATWYVLPSAGCSLPMLPA